MKYIQLIMIWGIFCCIYAKSPDELYKNAKKLLNKSPKESLYFYNEAIRYSDSSWKKRAKCFYDRGKLLFNNKQIIPALKDFLETTKLDVNHYDANKQTAICFFLIQKYKQSLHFLEIIEKLKPKDEEIYYLRGRIFLDLYEQGKTMMESNILNSSIKEFNKAIDNKRKYHEAYYFRGRAYLIGGFPEDAINDFNKAVKIKKNYYPALFESAIAHLKLKQNIKSIEALEKCISFKKDHLAALKFLLDLCHQSRFTEKITIYLKDALQYYPTDLYFRKLNEIYKIIPENDLPILPKRKEENIPKQNQSITQKKKINQPKSTWLELPSEEDKEEEKPPKIEIKKPPKKTIPEKKELKIKRKTSDDFSNDIWY